MSDNLRFFSSQSPESSHGHRNKQKSREKNFGPPPPPWKDPGAYRNGTHIRRIQAEMQRLISTDGPKTSWLFSEQSSKSQKSGANGSLQKKLTVGSANDPLEKEADAVAERVMRNPKDFYLDPRVSSYRPAMQRPPAGGTIARENLNEQEQETAQLKSNTPDISRMAGEEEEMQQATLQLDSQGPGAEGGPVSEELQQRIDGVRNTGGEKLPESEREFFESRMGHDFGEVRIHTGSEAAQVSRDVNAKAFTIGRDVVFGAGEYKPGTPEGRRLMAHELTHTVQQGASGGAVSRQTIQRATRIGTFYWRPEGNKESTVTVPGPVGGVPIPAGGYNEIPIRSRTRSEWREFLQGSVSMLGTAGNIFGAAFSHSDAEELAVFMALASGINLRDLAIDPEIDLGFFKPGLDQSVDFKLEPASARVSAENAMELMRAFADIAGSELELDIPEIGNLAVNDMFRMFIEKYSARFFLEESAQANPNRDRIKGVADTFADAGGNLGILLNQSVNTAARGIGMIFNEGGNDGHQLLRGAGVQISGLIGAFVRKIGHEYEAGIVGKIISELAESGIEHYTRIPGSGMLIKDVLDSLGTKIAQNLREVVARDKLMDPRRFRDADAARDYVMHSFKAEILKVIVSAIEEAARTAIERGADRNAMHERRESARRTLQESVLGLAATS